MNDPHVAAIHYRVEFGEGAEYTSMGTTSFFTNGDFDVTVRDTDVVLIPRVHFADRASAVVVAEPLIAAWQREVAIRLRIPRLAIAYQRTEMIDRAPTPGRIELYCEATGVSVVAATAVLVRVIAAPPPPPDPEFAVTPDVDSLWHRYVGYCDGREPILSMAYFCFTVLTKAHGNRAEAAAALNVEEAVLRKLSELSSTRGDTATARKITTQMQPLTLSEQEWLDAAIRNLILQVGRACGGPPKVPLRMCDLPWL